MRTQARSGFTIIEVMLFLAVTGALTVGLLVGAGVAINQQRYRDSVNSFKGLIQEQYGQIANVINSEQENPVCTPSGNSLIMSGDTQQARGTSECLVIGRFLLIEPTMVTAYNLIGRPISSSSGTSDSAVLGGYAMSIEAPETHQISWGAKVVHPKSTDGVTTSMLIARSPLSGSILTYIYDGNQTLAVQEMISDANMVQKDFCIDSDGASALMHRRAVRINARAANQSAVEIPLEEDSICD